MKLGRGSVGVVELAPASAHEQRSVKPCVDRVERPGLRPAALPHHRTCGFPHPAVEAGGSYFTARSDGMRKPWSRNTLLLRALCRLPVRAMGQAPFRVEATFSIGPLTPNFWSAFLRPFLLCQRSQ